MIFFIYSNDAIIWRLDFIGIAILVLGLLVKISPDAADYSIEPPKLFGVLALHPTWVFLPECLPLRGVKDNSKTACDTESDSYPCPCRDGRRVRSRKTRR